jgi:hypothetical protein
MTRFRSSLRLATIMTITALMLMTGAVFAQSGGQPGGSSGAGQSPAGGSGTDSPGQPSPDTGARQPGDGSSGGAGNDSGRQGSVAGKTGQDQEAVFDEWLSRSGEGAKLSGLRDRLRSIAAPALKAGVPAEAFMARIREAVAKGVPPAVLIQALDEDSSRWIWLATVVRGSSWPPAEASAGFYLASAAALRNGLDEDGVRRVLSWAIGVRASAEKTGAALTTAAAVSLRLRSPAMGGDTALLLAQSKLKVGQFPAVAGLASKAIASGMSPGSFMATLEATIGRGSKLPDLEKALFN